MTGALRSSVPRMDRARMQRSRDTVFVQTMNTKMSLNPVSLSPESPTWPSGVTDVSASLSRYDKTRPNSP